MTRFRYHVAALLIPAASALISVSAANILVEGEAFQFKGKWVAEKSSDCLGSAMLRVYQDNRDDAASDALTVVDIPAAGTYSVWTRSQDYTGTVRPRTFTLTVNSTAMSPSGAHGSASFRWEKVGSVELPRKGALLRLTDTGHYYGRCDAILLTTDDSLDPNALTNTELARWRRNPAVMDYTTANAPSLSAPLEITSGYTTLASASNGEIRISFVKLPDSGAIVCKTDFYADGSWRRYGGQAEDNRLALICCGADAPSYNHNLFYPSWDSCTASRTFSFDGTDYPVVIDGDSSNPYFTGELSEPRATAVTKTSGNCIKVTYDCGGAGTLTGYWTVPESGRHIETRFLFRPAADGHFSLALHGAKGVKDDEADGVLMPPMFAGNRRPATPLMLLSSMMPQCLSAVTSTHPFGKATAFVAADLSGFPADWGGYDRSSAGFTLRDSRGMLQPVAFAPLPGMAASRVKAGRSLEVKFITGISAGSYDDALEYASENIFGVTDYRRPLDCSVSDIAANITALLGDDTYSGWEPSLKGFWDIEADGTTAPTVVHSSPLAIIGAAAMTADEALYERRALPAIEYLLSRNGYRTRANRPEKLAPLASQFPTTLYEGINTLSGGLNPWLSSLALPAGEVRSANGYFSTLQPFRQELAAYRLTGDEARLQRAVTLADTYATEILSDRMQPMDYGNFYNSRMIPDWTSLLDIYELAGKELYLDAAIHGASLTIAGVKSWPKVAEGLQTVHPGGSYDGVTTIWWKGAEPFRLGFPRKPGDSPRHEVEAWKVSPVGLGMEQPATFFPRTAGKTVRPVHLNSWAPRLLELSAYSGRAIHETYARNAVIGRGDNYPGYYATGFTDIPLSSRFPYEGPDVSSIYYHHIPAHLAMIQDYLSTSITLRSNGAVKFETARQEGFVWFANNIIGNTRVSINGEEARVYMPAGAIKGDNPAVSILSARNASRLFIMLVNESDAEATVNLSLSSAIADRIDDRKSHIGGIRVAPRGVVILTLDASFPDYGTASPLADGMEIIPTDTPAGNIYLFRIRSPFGWDSLYGFADCADVAGLSITAESNGAEKQAASWPYEFSFMRYGYDEEAPVNITVNIDGKPLKSISHKFSPSSGSIAGVAADLLHAPSRKGIFTADGRRIERIDAPGFYIVDGKKKIVR